jgi:hypothetical protein
MSSLAKSRFCQACQSVCTLRQARPRRRSHCGSGSAQTYRQPSAILIKPQFVRRIGYIDDTGRRNTRKCGLKAAQARELALCLGRYQLPLRHALTGCRRYRDRIELNPGVRQRLKGFVAPEPTPN